MVKVVTDEARRGQTPEGLLMIYTSVTDITTPFYHKIYVYYITERFVQCMLFNGVGIPTVINTLGS